MFTIRPSTTPAHKMFFDPKKLGKKPFNGNSPFPFRKMNVGQSFFIPEIDLKPRIKLRVREDVYRYNRNYDRVFRLIKRKITVNGLWQWEWEIARIY